MSLFIGVDSTKCLSDEDTIMYFIEWSIASANYRKVLQVDHEPDEIEQHLSVCQSIIAQKAHIKMFMCKYLRNSDQDQYNFQISEDMFFDALRYNIKYYSDQTDIKSLLMLFSKVKGTPKSLNMQKLYAAVNGNFELEKALSSI